MWIEAPIYCHTEETAALKDLEIESEIDDFEVRLCMINADLIQTCYPARIKAPDKPETIVHINGHTFSVALAYEDFKTLIGVNYKSLK